MTHARVLCIAYVFPPLGGSGVYRTTKFVKYLPQFGWAPIVVCGDHGLLFGLSLDPTLLSDVPPEARVLRMPFVSPYGVRSRLKRLLRISADESRQEAAAPGGGSGTAGGSKSGGPAREALRRLGRALKPIESPPIDIAFYWALSIVPLCRRVIEAENVDVIYTSADPYSDHLAGWMLKRLTGRPWVADFRDPWTQAWNYDRQGLRRRIDLFTEQCVLHDADRIIGVTPSQTQGLRDLIPRRHPADFTTIENGFDEQDFLYEYNQACPARLEQDGKVTLAHVGIVYDGTVLPLLQALEQLRSCTARLHVQFVGGLAPTESRWLASHSLKAKVRVSPRVSHRQAVAFMRSADALLLAFGNGPRWTGHYPGKLFEYMRSGRPIILVGPQGEANRLLEASGTGIRLPLERQAEAAAMLSLLARDPAEFRARYYHPNPTLIACYERRALTGRLAALFDELVEARDGR